MTYVVPVMQVIVIIIDMNRTKSDGLLKTFKNSQVLLYYTTTLYQKGEK